MNKGESSRALTLHRALEILVESSRFSDACDMGGQ